MARRGLLRTYVAKFLSRKHLFLSSPAQSCTPTIPKMKKTKKHKRRTLPNIGRVSNSRVTSIRIPAGRRRQVRGALCWGVHKCPEFPCAARLHPAARASQAEDLRCINQILVNFSFKEQAPVPFERFPRAGRTRPEAQPRLLSPHTLMAWP